MQVDFFVIKSKDSSDVFDSLVDIVYPSIGAALACFYESVGIVGILFAQNNRIYHIEVTDRNELIRNFKAPTKITGWKSLAEITVDVNSDSL